MFVELVRHHLDTITDVSSGWLAGLIDPLVSSALATLHHDPAHHWTLPSLAADIGTSRSVLTERFTSLVGIPPMRYLTQWRMQLAARLLVERPMKLVAVADAVGYASEAAFSRAFKKHTGVSPAEWRRRAPA
jgi:AraC-like DNA-binding protein